MQVLLITQCSKSDYWYADLVGTHQPFTGRVSEGYLSREPKGYINVVQQQDAIVVEKKPHELK